MSPEYASASLLGGQSGNGLPFIAGIGGWGVGEYSTAAHRQLVDAATSTQAMIQPFYASPPPQGPASANVAAAAAYAWTSPTGTFIQRSLSQQQFHQPFWAAQPGKWPIVISPIKSFLEIVCDSLGLDGYLKPSAEKGEFWGDLICY